MSTIEDLSQKSISEMSTDETIELLRAIRLSRRTQKVSSKRYTKKYTKKESKSKKELTKAEAQKLLKLLGG
jgi:hypothetical protein